MSSMEAAARMGSQRSHRRHAAHRLKSTLQQMPPLLRAQEHLNVTKCLLRVISETENGPVLIWSIKNTHTLVFTLAPDSSSPCAEQPSGAASWAHTGRARPNGHPRASNAEPDSMVHSAELFLF